MYSYIVNKSEFNGKITIPPSKSETLRAILFASLAEKKCQIHNFLISNDSESMIQAFRHLGAKIEIQENKLEIIGLDGNINKADDVINAGNSGIVLRFCTAIAALSKYPIVITGDDSIRHQRPMKPLIEALKQANVKVISTKNDGFAPLIIQGEMKSGTLTLNGEDSQPVSALLIAASFVKGETEIFVTNPGEKPWIDMTLSWLDRLSIPYENNNYSHYKLKGNNKIESFDFHVPGDLSSAAFPIAAALITQSELMIENVDMNSNQGDKALIYLFQKMGAHIEIDEKKRSIFVRKSFLKGLEVDINDFVDSVTILAVVACFAEGETKILNCSIARNKECNRLFAITTELKKMGANIEETEDGLIVRQSSLNGAIVSSHKDHRMCMSLAVAAFGASSETTILDTDCVKKTYPNFLNAFQSIGAHIKQKEI